MADTASIDEVLRNAERSMARSVEVFTKETDTIRTGRANPAMLDALRVDYYGTPTPLNQLATVGAPEPRLLVITPWDRKMMPVIEKEILKSDLGLTPNNDGQVIRLAIPPMTQERRKEMVKRLNKFQEEAHIAIRNVRRDGVEALRKLEREKQISEDDLRRAQERLQKITDAQIAAADAVSSRKEKELMEV
ncbi:MAG: ribosome recycling factor [SAR202 cluster bacterium]|nr:ribosome recycling factor [SAR202 cluster bacterium]